MSYIDTIVETIEEGIERNESLHTNPNLYNDINDNDNDDENDNENKNQKNENNKANTKVNMKANMKARKESDSHHRKNNKNNIKTKKGSDASDGGANEFVNREGTLSITEGLPVENMVGFAKYDDEKDQTNTCNLWAAIDYMIEQKGMIAVILLRLTPFPMEPLNYILRYGFLCLCLILRCGVS